MLCPRHNVDHAPARAQHPAELLLCKGRKAVQQHVCPAVRTGWLKLDATAYCAAAAPLPPTAPRACDIEPGQLQRLFCRRELLRDAAVVPARRSLHPADAAGRPSRRARRGQGTTPPAPARKCRNIRRSGRRGGRQPSPCCPRGLWCACSAPAKDASSLPGTVKTVAFFAFQVVFPLQRAAAQGALPRGKGFVPAHTSSL